MATKSSPPTNGLREYVPLEQGLRRSFTNFLASSSFLREYVPLEQGLRPSAANYDSQHLHELREYVPLEQGLRPHNIFIYKLHFPSESMFH